MTATLVYLVLLPLVPRLRRRPLDSPAPTTDRLGRWFLASATAALVLLHAVVLSMAFRLGTLQRADAVRSVLTVALLVCVWRGHEWARLLFGGLAVATGIYGMVVGFPTGRPGLAGLGVLFASLGVGLLAIPSVRRYSRGLSDSSAPTETDPWPRP